MARFDASRLTRGLVGNVSAQALAFLAQLVTQVLSVAVLAPLWGAEQYGAWLILFTVPGYVTLLALGFTGAAGNELTAAVAQDRRTDAMQIYAGIRGAFALLALAVLAMLALITVSGVIPHSLLQFARSYSAADPLFAVTLLVVYAIATFQATTWAIALRATDESAVHVARIL